MNKDVIKERLGLLKYILSVIVGLALLIGSWLVEQIEVDKELKITAAYVSVAALVLTAVVLLVNMFKMTSQLKDKDEGGKNV